MVDKGNLGEALQVVWDLADENPDSQRGSGPQALDIVGHFIRQVFVNDESFDNYVG